MGLFINKNEHPDVYKNIETIHAPNQRYVRRNPLTELINEQHIVNMNLTKSIDELKPRFEQLEELQTTQWNNVKLQINDLIVRNREEMENLMIQRLNTLDENDILLRKSVIDQMNSLSESYQNMLSRLEKNETSYQQLTLILDKQHDLQKDIAEAMLKQGEFQSGVLNRLDTQEALIDKISHQLTNIRSILFERANYIATKLEDGFNLTSAYVYKLVTNKEHPTFTTLLNNKKKKNQKQSD